MRTTQQWRVRLVLAAMVGMLGLGVVAAAPGNTAPLPGTSFVGNEKSFNLNWRFVGSETRAIQYVVAVRPVGKGELIAKRTEAFNFTITIPAGDLNPRTRVDKLSLFSSAPTFNSNQTWTATVYTEAGDETLTMNLKEEQIMADKLVWSQSRYHTSEPQLFYLDRVRDGLFVDVKPVWGNNPICPVPDPDPSPFPFPKPDFPGPIPSPCLTSPAPPMFGSS